MIHIDVRYILFFFWSCNITRVIYCMQPGYELDVIPPNLAERTKPKASVSADEKYSKHIPRKIWMAVKDVKDELPGHITAFFKRNVEWEQHVCDNDCKDSFMNSTFAGAFYM